jgi:hypothetical protein
MEEKENWSRIPDGGMISGETGPLVVGRNLTSASDTQHYTSDDIKLQIYILVTFVQQSVTCPPEYVINPIFKKLHF